MVMFDNMLPILHTCSADGTSPVLKRTGSDGSMLLKINEKFDYERLKLDFRLKEADNRFLQEELENKDKMLTMLTEGLKEVPTII
jgi:hypothetical protein